MARKACTKQVLERRCVQAAAGAGAGAGAEAEAEASEARPMITMPGSKPTGFSHYDDDGPQGADQSEREADAGKPPGGEAKGGSGGAGGAGGSGGAGGGWLGGFLTRLSRRAPNQMILPDDKDPAVSARRNAYFPPTLL
ncbi:hypothetical protein ACJJTC_006151 [Scirpophaga incertulas]